MLDGSAGLVIAGRIGRLNRRRLIRLVAGGAFVSFAVACGGDNGDGQDTRDGFQTGSPANVDPPRVTVNASAAAAGKLFARPANVPPPGEIKWGLQSLGLDREEDAILYVPETYRPEQPAPLAVLFHGAGGGVRAGISPLLNHADMAGTLLLATSSREGTWDIITSGAFGADIALLERALVAIFSRYAVDPGRIAVGGFSDGASYALSVGLTNGDLFSAIMAFSPGFVAPSAVQGQPRIYISHGTQDIVLPIDQTSRLIVPQLQGMGYQVEYVEFEGLHSVPNDIVEDALDWWLNAD